MADEGQMQATVHLAVEGRERHAPAAVGPVVAIAVDEGVLSAVACSGH